MVSDQIGKLIVFHQPKRKMKKSY